MRKTNCIFGLCLLVALSGLDQAMGQWAASGTNIYNTNTGYVGIGNSAPTKLLYVGKNMTEPTITVRNFGGSGGSTFQMLDDASGADWKFKATNTGGFKIRDNAGLLDVITIEANSAANMLYITSSDKFGIGTSAPTANLDVRGNSTDDGVVIQVGNSDLSHRLVLFGGRLNDPNPFIQWKEGDPLRFSTDEGGWSEKMRITSAGNVGIGTEVPAAKLDVNGGDALINGLTVGKGTGSGAWNSALGDLALSSNTTGWANTGSGNVSLKSNTTGYRNTGFGAQSLENNTSGYQNTAIGSSALMSNTTGNNNTAGGFLALGGNTTGIDNTAFGSAALMSNTTGYHNSAYGSGALINNTTGTNNTVSGTTAMYLNTTGNCNIAIGSGTLQSNTTGSDNTAAGFMTLCFNTTGYSNVALGSHALCKNTDRSNLVAIGDSALYNNGIGAAEDIDGSYNTAVGSKALYANTTGYSNTASGYHALIANTTGISNTAVGDGALLVNTTGSFNTAVGNYALSSADNYYLTGLGHHADVSSTDIGNSTVIGDAALVNASNKVRIGDVTMSVIEGQVAWSYPSDGRFKLNVSEEIKGLDFIRLLRPVVYNFDTRKYTEFLVKDMPAEQQDKYLKGKDFGPSTAMRHSGFVAQEVEEAARAAGCDFDGVHVPADGNDNYSIAYSQFVVPLVKAVQEQQEMIEDQKALIEAQRLQIEELTETVNRHIRQ